MHRTCDFFFFFDLLCILKKTVANMWLNGTAEVVGDVGRHHTEQEICNSLVVFILALFSNLYIYQLIIFSNCSVF